MISLQAESQSQPDLIQYAKPIIGTEKMGHTFPGATVPFGAVQLSPDTDTIPYESNNKYKPIVNILSGDNPVRCMNRCLLCPWKY